MTDITGKEVVEGIKNYIGRYGIGSVTLEVVVDAADECFFTEVVGDELIAFLTYIDKLTARNAVLEEALEIAIETLEGIVDYKVAWSEREGGLLDCKDSAKLTLAKLTAHQKVKGE
jgi:hypothetical protein